MLPKNRRLTTKDFKEIFDRGRSFRGRHFVLRIANMSRGQPTLFGFSVSKKSFKNASDRNFLRRQGYSVISKTIQNIKPDFKCLFSMNKLSSKPSFVELLQDITTLLKESGLLK
jgi:ribonuclease P protein component